MHFNSLHSALPTLTLLALVGCGEQGPSAEELNQNIGTMSSTTASQTPTTAAPTSSTSAQSTTATATTTAPAQTTSNVVTTTATATTTAHSTAPTETTEPDTSATPETTTSSESTAPVESTEPEETTSAETSSAETTSTAAESTEPVPEGPYAPRTGSFKMLIFSKTGGWRHSDAILAGQQTITAMATEQGFETKFTETNEEFTVDGLSQYEIVFFLNTTGNIFSDAEKAAFEEWMKMHDGAFAGVHSATDTENGWSFYSEVTGQYYNGHSMSPDTPGEVQWDASQIGHVAVQGLPSPWARRKAAVVFTCITRYQVGTSK